MSMMISPYRFGVTAGILGNTNISTNSSASVDRVRLVKAVTPSAGTILNVSLIAKATNASSKIRAVLYSDSAGVASSLLAQSSEQIGLVDTLTYTLTFTTPYAFSSGQSLWLGFHFGTSSATIGVGASALAARTSNTDSYSDGPASTYVGDFSTPANAWGFWSDVTY